jgi:hypothetical protein
MTRPALTPRPNPSKFHAAFRLHAFAPMLRFGLFLVAAALAFAFARPAFAQMGNTGTCTGTGTAMDLQGTVGLAIKNSEGRFETLAASNIGSAFSRADCECATTDVYLQIQVTKALPVSQQLGVSVWIGTGCESYDTRNNPQQTRCVKLTADDIPQTSFPTYNQFTTASTGGQFIYVPIPARKLFSPTATADMAMCDIASNTNGVFVILESGPSNQGVCSLTNLTQVGTLPIVDQNPRTAPGDGRVTLNWTAARQGERVTFFQVLCATDDYKVIPGVGGKEQMYSRCTATDGMKRRRLSTGGSVGGGGTTNPDLGTTSEPLEPLLTAETQTQAEFDNLHPDYLCSDRILSNQSSFTIGGLENNKTYRFRLVAVDDYGNAASSPTITGVPQPAEDLFQRYVASGGKASGFCFIATAAFGSYDSGWVKVLRDFRDEWLLPTPEGRAFVDWYYARGPEAAAYIAERPALRILVRMALIPVVAVAAIFVYTTATQKALALALLALVLIRRARRRGIA